MLDGDISSVEFKEMKNEIEEAISKLSLEQAKLKIGLDNFSETIDSSLNLLKNLEFYYASRNTEIKQRIISSIFIEKLVYENNKYRTPMTNRAIPLICRKKKAFEDKKGGKYTLKSVPSHGVEPGRFELPSKQGTKMLSTRLAVF